MTLCASNRRIHSHHGTPGEHENSRREQAWLRAEKENQERILQETRIGTLQETEESKKICGTGAERTQRLRMDELSQDSQSTVNQLTVQIQELQDKVNSLNDSSDFHDLETANTSGFSHIPSRP